LLFAAALAGTPAPSTSASPAAPPSPDVAVIRQSASTNRSAFEIAVPRTGPADVRAGTAKRSTPLDAALVAKLYADLERAGDLAALPIEPCMKSASFGSRTSLSYGGQDSGDVQCAASPQGRALNEDAQAIAQAALDGMPVNRRRTMPVFRKPPPPQPSTSPQ
jgi:hypothetical protein